MFHNVFTVGGSGRYCLVIHSRQNSPLLARNNHRPYNPPLIQLYHILLGPHHRPAPSPQPRAS